MYDVARSLEAGPSPCFKPASVQLEAQVAGGLFSADVLAEAPCGRQVIVEADGPTHFFVNEPGVETGSTVLRNRLLRALPERYTVVCVPFGTWDGPQRSAEDKRQLLRALLEREMAA